MIATPEIGVRTEASLGETILAKGKTYVKNGIVLKEPMKVGNILVSPGFFTAGTQDGGWVYYGNLQDLSGPAICLSKKDPSDLRVPSFAPAVTYHLRPDRPPVFERSTIEQLVEDAFKREIVFNGKTGTRLKLLYREMFGNASRVPYAQDFEYDLTEGNTLSFKGAQIEVLESSSTRIVFRVLEPFSN